MADAICVIDKDNYDYYRKLGANIQLFQSKIAPGFNGLPVQLIDPSVLAEATLLYNTPDEIPDDLVTKAAMLIEVQDGLPVIEGVPVWERLDGERLEFYRYFKTYLELSDTYGYRSIPLLSEQVGVSGKYLNTLFKVYHWALRSRAYDASRSLIETRQRAKAIRTLEDKHSKAADDLLTGAMDYLRDHPEQLNPKIAVQMIQTAVKVGRLALGLSGDGNQRGNTTNVSVSTQNTTSETNTTNNVVATQSTNLEELQSILHVLDRSGAFGVSDTVPSGTQEVVDITCQEEA